MTATIFSLITSVFRRRLTIGFKLFYTDDGRTQAVKVVEELRQ